MILVGVALYLVALDRHRRRASLTLVSYFGIVVIWMLRNVRIPGFACAVASALCNKVVGSANGGRMPVDSADPVLGALLDRCKHAVSMACRPLPYSDPFPCGVTYRPGDILVAIGIVWFFAALMRPKGRTWARDARLDEGARAA